MARIIIVAILIVLSEWMLLASEKGRKILLPMYWTAVMIYWISGLLEVA